MRGENSEPLNIHLVWGSVWERNYKDLHRSAGYVSLADAVVP